MRAITITLLIIFFSQAASAQSSVAMDVPIQQCITQKQANLKVLKSDFRISRWLNKLVNMTEQAKTDPKGGGQYGLQIMEEEDELGELVGLVENCPALSKAKSDLSDIRSLLIEGRRENFLSMTAVNMIKAKAEKTQKTLRR